MKRGVFAWRARELSLMLILLVCATIVVCTWVKTPILSTILPPKYQHLKLPFNAIMDDSTSNLPSTEPKTGLSDDVSSAVENLILKVNQKKKEATTIPPISRDSADLTTPGRLRNATTLENENDKDSVNPVKYEDDMVNDKKGTLGSEGVVGAEKKEILEKRNSEEGWDSYKTAAKPEKETSGREDVNNATNAAKAQNQACNYAKGKWVTDERRPLYSGHECKRWLASMWACRLMQRKDFAFENLRWQPKDCEMEEFEGSKFLKRMQDKTLAFVGDSLGRQQFQSLMCMITSGKSRPDVLDVGKEYGFVTPRHGGRPSGWAYRFPETNTTILYHWSASLCDVEPIDPSNPSTEFAMHLDRPPAFLRNYLHKFNVLVLNTGHHWNRGKLKANRWVMYVGGAPNTDKKLAPIGNAKNLTIHSIVSWVNSQLPNYPHMKAFYRSISPRHFVGGDWNTGGSCNNTTPMSIGKEVSQEQSSDYSAWSATRGTGVKLLDITAVSQVRDEGHISRFSITASSGVQDCLHWCLPGVPDTWNEILYTQI